VRGPGQLAAACSAMPSTRRAAVPQRAVTQALTYSCFCCWTASAAGLQQHNSNRCMHHLACNGSTAVAAASSNSKAGLAATYGAQATAQSTHRILQQQAARPRWHQETCAPPSALPSTTLKTPTRRHTDHLLRWQPLSTDTYIAAIAGPDCRCPTLPSHLLSAHRDAAMAHRQRTCPAAHSRLLPNSGTQQ
jgi:hypothetical protein